MRRISSVEGRRLLELARQQRAQLTGGALGECWAVVIEALSRGYLAADGADSLSALVAELESGGGMRVEDLAIEVSFDDPRGETVVLALAGEQLLASRSALVRELRRLLRAYRGEEALAPTQTAAGTADLGTAVQSSSEARHADADVGELSGSGDHAPKVVQGEPGEPGEPVAEARVELREALSRIGGLLKERLVAAAARTDAELERTGAAVGPQVESAADSVRQRVEGALGALRDAAARAQAREAQAHGEESAPSAAEAPKAALPKDPKALLAELRHQLGAGPGHGDSRRKLAEAARRFGGEGERKEGGKLAAVAERFAAWVEDESRGGAAVEGLLGKLAEALESARAQAAAGAGEDGAREPADPPKRHLHLVRDEPSPPAAAPVARPGSGDVREGGPDGKPGGGPDGKPESPPDDN